MLAVHFKNKFNNDLKLAKRRRKQIHKLKKIMKLLLEEKPLPKMLLDHPLKGKYADCRECHVEPDWLLIYLIQGDTITFIRTGTHADLFR